MSLTMTSGALIEGIKLARIITSTTLPKGTATAGNATGTMGESTVDLASIIPANGTLLIGDKFKIQGDSTTYTVTSQSNASTGSISGLSIEPPLQKSCMDSVISIFSGNETINFDTAEEASMEPEIEEGVNKVKRNKNTILGRVKTDDLVSGLTVTLTSATLIPRVMQIVDGGTLTGTGMSTQYNAPPVGVPVVKEKFTLELYTAALNGDGSVLHYVKFVFPNCVGVPIKYEFKDGDFFVPELEITSSPAIGQSPYSWSYAEDLPTV